MWWRISSFGGVPFRLLRGIVGFAAACVRVLGRTTAYLLAVALAFFVAMNFLLGTGKDVAYRNVHPAEEICRDGLDKPWSILADSDPGNDEDAAIARDGAWDRRLRCSIQRHVIPATAGSAHAVSTPGEPAPGPLRYHLAFLEYRENGAPYSLVHDGGKPYRAEEIRALDGGRPPTVESPLPISQLDVLLRHLSSRSNYVVVFVHGWRHDASVGDRNVADLRHYAAHAARYVAERCALERARGPDTARPTPARVGYCEMEVTAVYVGWRGARVDENALRSLGPVGAALGEVAAWPTLFDRKPVSEQVAPSVLSALRSIDRALSPKDSRGDPKADARPNRMIVFGHSLGGNILATGLEQDAIKAVRRHGDGEILPPLVGNLAVLVNPASEAAKWTSIQREVWRRIPFHVNDVTPFKDVLRSQRFWAIEQRPVVISVTSALGFPPGRLRDGDCLWLQAMGREGLLKSIADHTEQFDQTGVYDWATRELFPAFKGDLQPLVQRFDAARARAEGLPIPGTECAPPPPVPWTGRVLAVPWIALSAALSTFPFQNRDSGSTRTIGHLDPPRPGTSFNSNNLTSAAPFGTTHEMFPARYGQVERPIRYVDTPSADISCPPANGWLHRARIAEARHNGTFWSSARLGEPLGDPATEGPPAAHFTHGFPLGGTAAVTRAADPFWNVRVANSVISEHDGYRLSSFICAMNQFVLDEVTRIPSSIVDRVSDPFLPTPP